MRLATYVSERRQSQLVRLLQAVMVGILVVGLLARNSGVIVNAAVGLLVTFLPAYLERNYAFTMNVGLVLWITVAMFLHAFGTLPLPMLDFLSPYSATWWWDHMTHALSSSLVAGVAYATVVALDEHSEFVHMPPKFLFVFMLLFVLAFGVVWELLEFYISVAAALVGSDSVLTQYGLEDTVLDLFYNSVGGLVVAVFGSAHLSGISRELAERLDARSANR
ncbi:hypothetical protein [Halogeometricum luteum]|uniref:Uncharacterized protein n=1 Tax=Halogeometricum luteum TaxID=2950537 RepID=A0ABU2G3Y5_9EURY|nr:hypothetical protein [Halogeometricum sp. S3BR5-2]MDS0294988.1 hypothetical protein [Halogeometricum sp. S3BR5-2]